MKWAYFSFQNIQRMILIIVIITGHHGASASTNHNKFRNNEVKESSTSRVPNNPSSASKTFQALGDPTSQPTTQPSNQPTSQPSIQPTFQPSTQPSSQPSTQPSSQPISTPSTQPTRSPTVQPSSSPSSQPSRRPSTQPSSQPSNQPSAQPNIHPSSQPTGTPSCQPSSRPSTQPTASPTVQPSSRPSNQPTTRPTTQPSGTPSEQPSGVPSRQPSAKPSQQPSARPSVQPSTQPLVSPSSQPSGRPTIQPSTNPSAQPSATPTEQPSSHPSTQPSSQPTITPSCQPSSTPSNQPSSQPTSLPSQQPSTTPSSQPTIAPSAQPSTSPTVQPSGEPSGQPSMQPSALPSAQPTISPTTQPSAHPTQQPSDSPSCQPSMEPSSQPSTLPTKQPTSQPSSSPSSQPSSVPSSQPSTLPSEQPSSAPSSQPTQSPTHQPTGLPSSQPSSLPSTQPSVQPSGSPTQQPSSLPSSQPSSFPSHQPSTSPSSQPSASPSAQPSSFPSTQPSTQPSAFPTTQPSVFPSSQPSSTPSQQPSSQPSTLPSSQPSDQPSGMPSTQPTSLPSEQPSCQPSINPTSQPSANPTVQPSSRPSTQPTIVPTSQPSSDPSQQPSSQPTSLPSSQPSATPSSQPSSNPSSQPSAFPSTQPSQIPSVQPSSRPSFQPSTLPSNQPSALPSTQPTTAPTSQPSDVPSSQPTMVPTTQPSSQPSSLPTSQPSVCPSSQPSALPTTQPSAVPSGQPSMRPSVQPSALPSRQPTSLPSGQPSNKPSMQPSNLPSSQPTNLPSSQPTVAPTSQPSSVPSAQPSVFPTSQPSGCPSTQPTSLPTSQPFTLPSVQPSAAPSQQPSSAPSTQPSGLPTNQPSNVPSTQPSSVPSTQPSSQPTCVPSRQPSSIPSTQPSSNPSSQPSTVPSTQPTNSPTTQPSAYPSIQPSSFPTSQPSIVPSAQPSSAPSTQPSTTPSIQPSGAPSMQPSAKPSSQPTQMPSAQPSSLPSSQPSCKPTFQPSSVPSTQPSQQPSSRPSAQPSGTPSSQPTIFPSTQPTSLPSQQPSALPSTQPSSCPTTQPSTVPTSQPSIVPTSQPSVRPSMQPSACPTSQPSTAPTNQPSSAPSSQPSGSPTCQPTSQPSVVPSVQPSSLPSIQPTAKPSTQPSLRPSGQPSTAPSTQPSVKPSAQPSTQPTMLPSSQPSNTPSSQPSAHPSQQPTSAPSSQPTGVPSTQPTSQPSSQPSMQPTCMPSSQPSARPSSQPSSKPSQQPTAVPTEQPTNTPSTQPSSQPSDRPSGQPSISPTSQPTSLPSSQPSAIPSNQPSTIPSNQPTSSPTTQPSRQPSAQPSSQPSVSPSSQPSARPSTQPSTKPSNQPSSMPSTQPSTSPTTQPSSQPSVQPSAQPSCKPSNQPSEKPSTQPSAAPTHQPSSQPSISPTQHPSGQPSSQPTARPTTQPSSAPTCQPSMHPSTQPSTQPSAQPSSQPSAVPSTQPSSHPSTQPSARPSSQPSGKPTSQPTNSPTTQPSTRPSTQPSSQPSRQPSGHPTGQPSSRPSTQPSTQPSRQPSSQPSTQPSTHPSSQPSSKPSSQPTRRPTSQPSCQPSMQPTSHPSSQPSCSPTNQPSGRPSTQPSVQPSSQPSTQPTGQPSRRPTCQPSSQPTVKPSTQPSSLPSSQPSSQPTSLPSFQPSSLPTNQPSTQPTNRPTSQPSRRPTTQPTGQPSRQPTGQPSRQPTRQPTGQPSRSPTGQPSRQPTSQPTSQPSVLPSTQPSSLPSMQPTIQPTSRPSCQPSVQPTSLPTCQPSSQPSRQPTSQPSAQPSRQPSSQPSRRPTSQPSGQPSRQPTSQPSRRPTTQPTGQPSRSPTTQPTTAPTRQPSSQPSRRPSTQPTTQPSRQPSGQPTRRPSSQPSGQPSRSPTCQPTGAPTNQPSSQPTSPTGQPTTQPSSHPTRQPTAQPTRQPTTQPSAQPSKSPSTQPTGAPSRQPSSQPSKAPTTQPTGQPSRQPSSQPTSKPSRQPTSQPSRKPSTQPSSQPSTQPSCSPTTQPSGQPTVRPTSSRPTSEPSAAPSKSPVTSHPSRDGDTTRPSRNPTSHPTVDMHYEITDSYQNYVRALPSYQSIAQSYTYGSYYFKGLSVDGTCDNWQSFTQNTLALPFDDVYFSAISVLFAYETSTKPIQSAAKNLTCRDREVIKPLVASLQSGVSFTGNCEGNTWRVFTCDTARIFCVNCKLNCATSVICPGTGFVVSSCTTCKTLSASSAIVNVQYRREKLYPQISGTMNVTAGRDSLGVALNVSKAGNIYCAALPRSTVLTTVVNIKSSGVSGIALDGGVVSLTLPKLSPQTSYTVYCYTDDFMSHTMTLSDAVSSAVNVDTLCCRNVVVYTAHSTVVQYLGNSLTEQPFTIGLDSQPTSALQIRLQVSQVDCGSFAVISTRTSAVTQPSRFFFYPNSTVLRGSFLLRGSVTGCYQVRAVSSGLDYYTPANMSVVIRTTRVPPSLPVLSTAILSGDGSEVRFSFDSNTDRAANSNNAVLISAAATSGVFNCSRLLHFVSSNFATCKWLSATQVTAVLSISRALPEIGTTATLVSRTVRAECLTGVDCSSYAYVPLTVVNISAPITPIVPNATLSAPTKIGSCDDLSLDPTASQGFGSRAWSSVVWSVASSSPKVSQGNLTSISTLLNSNFPDTSKVAVVPNAFLFPGATYTFRLAVLNFLNLVGVASATVSVGVTSERFIPQVRIYGSSLVTYRWKPVNLFASATNPTCAGNSTQRLPLSYVWKVYQDLTYMPSIQSQSLDPRYFKLSPYTLNSESQYTVVVSVSLPSSNGVGQIQSTASTVIQLGRSGVTAVIAGGAAQTVSALGPFSVDGSGSFDLDYPITTTGSSDSSAASALRFVWSCSTVSLNFGSPCNIPLPSDNNAVWSVKAGALPAGTYSFTLTVTNTQGYSSATTLSLTVTSRSVPSMSIAGVAVKYNPGEKVILSCTLRTNFSITASWKSLTVANFAGSNIATTPLTRTFSPGVSTYQLGLAAHTLTAGLSYTFQIQVAFSSAPTALSSAAVTILMNQAPSGGILTVTPNRGQSMSTLYSLRTSMWIDDLGDYPINYVLAYYVLDAANMYVAKSIDEVTYVSSYLAPGLSSQSFAVTCVVFASDVYGGTANTTATAFVTQQSVANIVTATSNILANAAVSGNPTAVTQAVSAAVTSVNTVDCTVSVACSVLNRQSCSGTAKTCGACAVGYIGASGDSDGNTLCSLASSQLRQVGDTCAQNANCVTGSCEGGKCADVMKFCPNNCSNKGTCVFSDENDQLLSECSSSNPYCRATCECVEGSYGRDCALSRVTFNQLVSFRDQLCFSLRQTVSMQDVTQEVVVSRASTVSALLRDITQISSNALHNCTAVLVQTIETHPALSCQGTALSLMANALSNVLTLGTALPSALLSDVTDAISFLSTGCQQIVAVGEAPLVVTTANLRLLSLLSDKQSLTSRSYSVPQTALETFTRSPAARVSMNLSLVPSAGSVGLSIVQFINNPLGQRTNSSSVSVQATLYGDIPSSSSSVQVANRRRALVTRQLAEYADSSIAGVTVTLQNRAPIDYFELFESTMKLNCTNIANDEYSVSGLCPSGVTVTELCPVHEKGYYTVTCPARATKPQCTTFNGVDFEVNPRCRVLSYTAHNTTCYCEGSREAFGGNSRFLVESGALQQFSSSMVVTGTQPQSVYTAYPALTVISLDAAIVSTLSVILVIFIAGLLLFATWDQAESLLKKSVTAHKDSANLSSDRTIQGFYEALFPDAFRSGPWHSVVWQRMTLEHTWLCLLFNKSSSISSNNSGSDSTNSGSVSQEVRLMRAAKWTIAVMKVVIFLFIDTILFYVYYPDDTRCREFETIDKCVAAQSVDGFVAHSCHWRSENETCVFNPPSQSFGNVIVLSLVVLAVATPIHKLVVYCVHNVNRFLSRRSTVKLVLTAVPVVPLPAVADGAESKSSKSSVRHNASAERHDEFEFVQTVRGTILRAARLEKASKTMDFVLPSEETTLVMLQVREDLQRFSTHKLFKNAVDLAYYAMVRYGFAHVNYSAIQKQVYVAREKAAVLKRDLLQGSYSREEREVLLMKHCIVDTMEGPHRVIAERYFFPEGGVSTKRSPWRVLLELFSLALLPAMLGGMVICIYVFSAVIGSKSTDMWLLVVLMCIIQDVLVVQPVKIWFTWVVVLSSASEAARRVCEQLSRRTALILMRTSGVMRDSNALIQHFNPAVRVARMLPAMPVSRVLLSLGDWDIPTRQRHPIYFLPFVYLGNVLLTVAYLPTLLFDGTMDLLAVCAVNFLALGFYLLGLQDPVAAIVLCLAVLLCIALREAYVYFQTTWHLARRAKSTEKIDFYSVEGEKNVNKYDTGGLDVRADDDVHTVHSHFSQLSGQTDWRSRGPASVSGQRSVTSQSHKPGSRTSQHSVGSIGDNRYKSHKQAVAELLFDGTNNSVLSEIQEDGDEDDQSMFSESIYSKQQRSKQQRNSNSNGNGNGFSVKSGKVNNNSVKIYNSPYAGENGFLPAEESKFNEGGGYSNLASEFSQIRKSSKQNPGQQFDTRNQLPSLSPHRIENEIRDPYQHSFQSNKHHFNQQNSQFSKQFNQQQQQQSLYFDQTQSQTQSQSQQQSPYQQSPHQPSHVLQQHQLSANYPAPLYASDDIFDIPLLKVIGGPIAATTAVDSNYSNNNSHNSGQPFNNNSSNSVKGNYSIDNDDLQRNFNTRHNSDYADNHSQYSRNTPHNSHSRSNNSRSNNRNNIRNNSNSSAYNPNNSHFSHLSDDNSYGASVPHDLHSHYPDTSPSHFSGYNQHHYPAQQHQQQQPSGQQYNEIQQARLQELYAHSSHLNSMHSTEQYHNTTSKRHSAPRNNGMFHDSGDNESYFDSTDGRNQSRNRDRHGRTSRNDRNNDSNHVWSDASVSSFTTNIKTPHRTVYDDSYYNNGAAPIDLDGQSLVEQDRERQAQFTSPQQRQQQYIQTRALPPIEMSISPNNGNTIDDNNSTNSGSQHHKNAGRHRTRHGYRQKSGGMAGDGSGTFASPAQHHTIAGLGPGGQAIREKEQVPLSLKLLQLNADTKLPVLNILESDRGLGERLRVDKLQREQDKEREKQQQLTHPK